MNGGNFFTIVTVVIFVVHCFIVFSFHWLFFFFEYIICVLIILLFAVNTLIHFFN